MERSRRVEVALLTSAALAIRLFGLGRQALWSDELLRVTWSKGYELDRVFGVLPSETGIRQVPRGLGDVLEVVSRHYPPLHGALLNLWMRLVGDRDDDALVRLPNAVLSAAAVPVTYLALRRRFGEVASMAAAGMVALSPFHVQHAQEINHYPLAFLCVAVSFYFFLRYEESPDVKSGAGWTLAAVAGAYTHYYTCLVFLLQCLSLAYPAANGRRRPLAVIALPPLAACLSLVPYAVHVRHQVSEITNVAQIGEYLGVSYFIDRFRAMLVVPYLGEMGNHLAFAAQLPVILLSVSLVVYGLSRLQLPERRLLAVQAIGPVVLVVVLFFVTKTNSILWPRYQLFFSFGLYACVGVAFAALGRGALALAVVVAALSFVAVKYQHDVVAEDWQSVADVIDHNEAGAEPVFVYRQNLVDAVARYLDGQNRLFGVSPTPELESTVTAALRSEPTSSTGAFYASAWPEGDEMERRMLAVMARNYERCAAQAINPGTVSLKLFHCSVLRRQDDAEPPAFWLPRPMPLAENGFVGDRTASVVSGWAFSSAGLPTIRVVVDGQGRRRGTAPGILTPRRLQRVRNPSRRAHCTLRVLPPPEPRRSRRSSRQGARRPRRRYDLRAPRRPAAVTLGVRARRVAPTARSCDRLGPMKRRVLGAAFALGVTLCGSAGAVRPEIGGALNLDFNAGADTLAVLEFTDGSNQDIKAGNGAMLSVGGGLILFGPSQHTLELVLDVGVKYSGMKPAENADLAFVRVPIEALAFYRNESLYFRVGGGGALYTVNSLSGSGAASDIDVKFDPAVAGIIQADFIMRGFFAGLRYTALTYHTDLTPNGISASTIGVGLGYYYQFPGE